MDHAPYIAPMPATGRKALCNITAAQSELILELLKRELNSITRTIATLPHPDRPSAIVKNLRERERDLGELLFNLYEKHPSHAETH